MTVGQSSTFQPGEPIAIIGSGCRFPGGANSPSKLWDLLRAPRDVLKEIPLERFNPEGFYHPDGEYHGHTNVKYSYMLDEDHRRFDASFFNISANEASAIDPQQRFLLETVYEALEAAGLPLEQVRGTNTAVYVGAMCGEYSDLLIRDLNSLPVYFATGTARSILANRISYFYDWHGPSMTIDTACSSSLVALNHAVQTLRAGSSRIAVACGANILLGPEAYIAESKFHMLSPKGRSRMWDSQADGYGRGDGVAAVVLKTLKDAIADGDDIESIIRETGVNQDGRTKGITMPSADAQVALIEDTYRRAGLDINTAAGRCQYFEAHGTGTPAGDPIEAEAIYRALGSRIAGSETLSVGTIKSVVGHTEGTAGIAGLLKASLALQSSLILPNMLFEKLNPTVEPFYAHLQVPTTATPWPKLAPGTPRRASVNSFGFGGTNAHAIIESYEPSQENNGRNGAGTPVFTPILFSAATESSLKRTMVQFLEHIKKSPWLDIHDLSWTLRSRRTQFPVRAAVSGLSHDSLQISLEAAIETGNWIRVSNNGSQIIGIFTGQGAQWPGMGRELILKLHYVQERVSYLQSVLDSLPPDDRPSWSIKDELLADTESRLHEATIAQPLCTVLQIILVDLLHAANVRFSAVVGHSSGEIGAAYASGFLSARDALIIAYYRGLHSHLARGPDSGQGAMMAVGISPDAGREFCDRHIFKNKISVAACNSPFSITLSGDANAMEQAKDIFESDGKFARVLKVDKAYHSHHMLPCSQPYIDSLRSADIKPQSSSGQCRWFSSVHCREIKGPEDELDALYWAYNMTRCVMFSQAIEAAMSAMRGQLFATLEVGPHGALKGPTEDTMRGLGVSIPPHCSCMVRHKNDIESFASALGHIWKHSPAPIVDFEKFDRTISGNTAKKPKLLKNLPTYSWDHDGIHWQESRKSKKLRKRGSPGHPLLGTRVPEATEGDITWENILRVSELPWLSGHKLQGQIVFPAAGYVTLAIEAGLQIAGKNEVQLIEAKNVKIVRPITFEDERQRVETIFNLHIEDSKAVTEDSIAGSFRISCPSGRDNDNVVLVATGQIEVTLGRPTEAEILPPRAHPPPYMDHVEIDDLYSALKDVGYGYTDSFRGLSSLKRKLGRVAGLVKNPVGDMHISEGSLLVHPGMLDSTIQSLLLAHSWPGDGRLWSLHVPNAIGCVRVDPSACLTYKDALLSFDSVLTDASTAGRGRRDIYGDIELFSQDGCHAMIQVEGLCLVPFAPATASQDCQLFFNNVWNVASPDGELAVGQCKTPDHEIEFGWVLERVSYFYLRKLVREITQDDLKGAEYHHRKLLDYAHHVINCVEEGKQPYAKKEWNHDTEADLLAITDKYSDTIEIKLMRAVGDNLVAAVRGGTVILQHMLKDGMLNEYYADALGLKPCTAFVAEVAAQIAHRYPRMNILEVGAGTGAATKGITRRLGNAFSSYTYTDISAGFFETAREVFSGYSDRMIYRVLDVEKDVISQGFEERSYDMVVASNVLHATKDLNHTMSNVRRLLKPGGMLLLFEVTSNDTMRTSFTMGGISGWWIGADSGRPWSPCISSVQWNRLLLQNGFSGIDTITPEMDTLARPFSVMVSRVHDDRIKLLDEPTLSPSPDSRMHNLVLIGGVSLNTSQLVNKVARILRQHTVSLTVVESLDLVKSAEDVKPMSTVLLLSELDRPIFSDLKRSSFEGLKAIFSQARNILWVTRGCRGGNPYANAAVGFGRAAATEMSHLRLQFINLESDTKPDPRQLADALLRHQLTDSFEKQGLMEGMHWSIEPELSIEDGRVLIPRVVPENDSNDRYNSERRPIKTQVSQRKTKAKIDTTNGTRALRPMSLKSSNAVSDSVKIEAYYSLCCPIPVSETAALYPLIGREMKTNAAVLALSETNASVVEVSKSLVAPCALFSITPSSTQLLLVAYSLICRFVLMMSGKRSSLLLFEPDPLLLQIFRQTALPEDVTVHCIRTSRRSRAPNEIFLHPLASVRNIKASIPANVSYFVNASFHGRSRGIVEKITHCLASRCKKLNLSDAIGSHDLASDINVPLVKLLAASLDLRPAFSVPVPKATTVSPDEVAEESTSWSSVIDWTSNDTVSIDVEPVDSIPLLRSDRTYLLVGLAGGLGLTLTEWMVSQGARSIVLISRNPKVDHEWIVAMEAKGAKIHIYSSDVTDKISLQNLISDIHDRLPPLAGVANGAMVLSDTPLLEMSFEEMDKVLKPKVDGSRFLDEVLYEVPLDFFILFSSLSCVFGNSGQSNYSAANMYMVGLASQRRRRGFAASVIDIGAILGVGYISREATQHVLNQLSRTGYRFLSERDFHLAFAEAILAGHPDSGRSEEIITGLRVSKSNEETKPAWCSNPRFYHTVQRALDETQSSANKINTVSIRSLLQSAESLKKITQIIQDSVVEKMRVVLQLRADDIGSLLQRTADDLGIDSLVAVELRSWFLRELEVDMPVLKILGGATIGELVDHTIKHLPSELSHAIDSDDSSACSRPESVATVDTPYSEHSASSYIHTQSATSSQADLKPLDQVTKKIVQPLPRPILNGSSQTAIDWVKETAVEVTISQLKGRNNVIEGTEGLIIALTGATGFLGRSLLQKLVAMPQVKKIHCISVRNAAKLGEAKSAKVIAHQGDLSADDLGLTVQDKEQIFREANVVVHNGADVTFLKTYRRMKPTNVNSTKTLVQWALQFGNVKQFHFISSASVGQIASQEELYEEPVADYAPPADGANGYTTTKWVCEKYLESISSSTSMAVWIHRPSTITGVGAPDFDIMLNILRYSRSLGVVPDLKNLTGWFHFVEVEDVVQGITDEFYNDAIKWPERPIKYLNHCGNVEVEVHNLKDFLEKQDGKTYESINQKEWNNRAQKIGLPEPIAVYLEIADGTDKILQRMRRGPRAAA